MDSPGDSRSTDVLKISGQTKGEDLEGFGSPRGRVLGGFFDF